MPKGIFLAKITTKFVVYTSPIINLILDDWSSIPERGNDEDPIPH